MSEIIQASQGQLIVPSPKMELNIRPATMADVEFIDALQKKHNKQIGFMHLATLHGKIALGDVLVAESAPTGPHPGPLPGGEGGRVGYLIGSDRYFKRDDVGIIYHLNVSPGKQRGYVGAALLRAQFDRSAYGCRLYCCWCAQDIAANHFWEAMGFVPLAYRNGSESKDRVHIFWQKKIRGNEDKVNWWFPSKTDQGAMRADRLALPIPPGVHWSEVKPIVLPVLSVVEGPALSAIEGPALSLVEGPGKQEAKALPRPRQRKAAPKHAPKPVPVVRVRVSYGAPTDDPEPLPAQVAPKTVEESPKVEPVKIERAKREKKKIDPQFVSAARELRDRYLEQVNENGYRLESAGKYDVVRSIGTTQAHTPPIKLLDAA